MVEKPSLQRIDRVLMTADTLGGVWTYAVDLCSALSRMGIEVILATRGRSMNHRQTRMVSAIPNLIVEEGDHKVEWMENPWDQVEEAGDWLLALEEIYRPDIIHLNDYSHANRNWSAPVVVVGHSCVYSWFDSVHGTPPPTEWTTYYQQVKNGLFAANRIIAPSHFMLRALQKHYGPFPPADCSVIHNGRTADLFDSTGRKQPFIAAAGRIWDEAKNMDLLDTIAPNLYWPLRIAGPRKHPDGRCSHLNNCEVAGILSERQIASMLSEAAVFVTATRYEPFGLGILEAALSGCALVLPDIPSMHEIWGSNVLFVSPDDEDGFTETLNKLCTDDGLRRSYAERALNHSAAFTAEKMAEGYVTAYKEVLTEHAIELRTRDVPGAEIPTERFVA